MTLFATILLSIAATVDFGSKTGEINRFIHGSGYGPKLYPRVKGERDEPLRAMRFAATRLHDWPLISPGQRICDIHFVFPLMHLDANDPQNYLFEPTDHVLDLATEELGSKRFIFRLGTSIEHTGDWNFNTRDPKDHVKYADACAGVVRHYLRGWANGRRRTDIVWEIFNEPDITPCWRGTKAAFFDLFLKTLKRIRREFPEAVVGGPALAHCDVDYLRELVRACKKEGVRPDFVSWHSYCHEPADILSQPARVRKMLDEEGLRDCGTYLDEWHYNLGWDVMTGQKADPKATDEKSVDLRRRIARSKGPGAINAIDSAAFTLAVMAGLQETPLDTSCFYGCAHDGWWGFRDGGRFNKNYHALVMNGELVQDYKFRVKAKSDAKSVTAFGVLSADGKKAALLVVDYRGKGALDVKVDGLEGWKVDSANVLDHTRDNAGVPVEFKAGVLRLPRKDAHSVAYLVRFVPHAAETVRYVDEFDLSVSSCGFGKKTVARKSVDGHPLTMKGEVHARGFGAHPEGVVAFRANGKVTAFDALVGLDDDCEKAFTNRIGKGYNGAAARFRVWADGAVVWTSPVVKAGGAPVAVHVALAGAREILLETCTGGAWFDYPSANADWAEARFTVGEGAELAVADDPALFEQFGRLTPPVRSEPRINGADIWGVRPGRPVLFRVPVSGLRPMKFAAKNLPDGVTLDARGVLRGTAPAAKGDYDIEVTAENAKGKATRTIRLAVGDTISLTPPMGWNSWNTLGYRLTAEKALAAAEAMDRTGLGDHGWSYINLDDWWEMNNSGCAEVRYRQRALGGREDVIGPARDEEGRINSNRSFPDMKAMTDRIHALGFKAGLYSSPGPLTCGQCEGSYKHELQDAARWADWGFDYLKYDMCTYFKVMNAELDGRKATADDWSKPYRLMTECLRKQNRDIVHAFCQYGLGNTATWGRSAGANCWRSWEDLKDSWTWMERALAGREGAAEPADWTGAGFWIDPDMMIVGQQYSYGYDHPTFLTPNEQYTHVSLWAMLSAPLMIGCDLTTIDDFTLGLLANDEVLSVSQDRLGKVARRLRESDAESVWTKPLSGGFTAVALVNRSPVTREMRVSFADLALPNACWVKDLWRQRCEGEKFSEYVVKVPPHATKLVKMRPSNCPKCD